MLHVNASIGRFRSVPFGTKFYSDWFTPIIISNVVHVDTLVGDCHYFGKKKTEMIDRLKKKKIRFRAFREFRARAEAPLLLLLPARPNDWFWTKRLPHVYARHDRIVFPERPCRRRIWAFRSNKVWMWRNVRMLTSLAFPCRLRRLQISSDYVG